jgi:hypothetical protein
MIRAGTQFGDPSCQANYLSDAIADDFPRKLTRASAGDAPGRSSYTGSRHLFIHEQNMAWLAHLALLHARDDTSTLTIDQPLIRRLCRMLLVGNDLLSSISEPNPQSLAERREFVLDYLRHGQFNRFFKPSGLVLLDLARQHVLLTQILPRHFPVEFAFSEARHVDLRTYLKILMLFVTHFYHSEMTNAWLSENRLFSTLAGGRDEVTRIFRTWIRGTHEYREAFRAWVSDRGTTAYGHAFDFTCLRETPIIRIDSRPDEVVCPILPFVIAKSIDEPYFILSSWVGERKDFQKALGLASQDYAHGLLERMASCDKQGPWIAVGNPTGPNNAELTDSYLQRASVAVVAEHKALRPPTDFLRGGSSDRVLGLPNSLLTRIDAGAAISLQEGKQADDGLFTRPMWQQSIAGPRLMEWAAKHGGHPQRVFPIITNFWNLRADEVVRRGYLEPLIQSTGLYREVGWERPQWLNISDLEALAALGEYGKLDLQAILEEKNAQYPHQRFDIYLYDRFPLPALIDRELHRVALALLKTTGARFWGTNA